MKSAERILYIGEFIGFAGGIERYVWQTARLLRAAGMCVDYLGTEPAQDETLFRSAGGRKLWTGRSAQALFPAAFEKAARHVRGETGIPGARS